MMFLPAQDLKNYCLRAFRQGITGSSINVYEYIFPSSR